MKNKKLFTFILVILFILLLTTNCFATIDFTYNNNNYIMPDLPTSPEGINNKDYFIYKTTNKYFLYIKYNDTANVVYDTSSSSFILTDFTQFEISSTSYDNSQKSWGNINLSVSATKRISSSFFIIYSTFNILDENGNIYFAGSVITPEPQPETLGGIDTLYIGDIPEEFCYAEFSDNYISLFNQSSAENEDLEYYKIYLYDNAFYYSTGTMHIDNIKNFQKINVTNNFFYRRDFINICLTTFIIIIFFLWVINLFTSIIYKGGILRGLF